MDYINIEQTINKILRKTKTQLEYFKRQSQNYRKLRV